MSQPEPRVRRMTSNVMGPTAAAMVKPRMRPRPTDAAHRLDMLLHIDGARLANAAAALDVSLAELTTQAGVDAVSFGGTKNGLLFGEAVVFCRAGLPPAGAPPLVLCLLPLLVPSTTAWFAPRRAPPPPPQSPPPPPPAPPRRPPPPPPPRR